MIIASNSALITICGMWSQFLDSGVVIFLHLKMATFGKFGCKKMGLRTPEYKNGDHFLSLFVNITQMMFQQKFENSIKNLDLDSRSWFGVKQLRIYKEEEKSDHRKNICKKGN